MGVVINTATVVKDVDFSRPAVSLVLGIFIIAFMGGKDLIRFNLKVSSVYTKSLKCIMHHLPSAGMKQCLHTTTINSRDERVTTN